MKIADVRFAIFTAPYYEPGMLRNYGVVVLRTEDERVGLGEPYAAVNMPTVCREALRLLATELIGKDATAIELLLARLHVLCEYFDHRGLIYCLLGAVEWALADLAAQRAGLPLHRYLNAASADSVQLYASTAPATWSTSRVLEDLEEAHRKGFRFAKIRAGCCSESLEQAIERARIIAQGRPRGLQLGVDAGQQIFYGSSCWDLDSATRLARALAELDIAFLEDPLLIHDREGYVALRKLELVPIAGGEMFAEPEQFEAYIEAGAWDVAQPDASVLSGPRACLRVAECARRHGIRVVTHGWAGPVAQMQNIHVALASPACDLVEFCTFPHPLMAEMLAPLWKFENGRFLAPTLPGMGLTLTDDLERRYPHDESVVHLIA